MFFSQLLAKFRPQPDQQSARKRAAIQRRESIIKHKPEQPSLKTDETLNTSNKINKALNDIDKSIQSEGATNELLLKKAELLLRKGKFRLARQILNKISKNKSDSKASNLAIKLLAISQELQQETGTTKTNKLANNLHSSAKKYNHKLVNIPQTDSFSTDQDITQLVRAEARRARNTELPKLSYELIELTLEAGHESPWLLHDKALSLSMMGQQEKALDILNELKKANKGEKLTSSIDKNIEGIKKNSKQYQFKSKTCLAKQSKLLAKASKLKLQLPEKINEKTNVKALVFKQARACLSDNPQACLSLVNSILDYFPGDLASLQLKGEVFAETKQADKAIHIWKDLAKSKNEKVAQKARELISSSLIQEAGKINANRAPKAIVSSLIEQHLKHNLAPVLNKEIEEILLKTELFDFDSSAPELQQHQLQLLLNTLTIECLEAQLHEQGRLNPTAPAQKPGSIRKTAPKAG